MQYPSYTWDTDEQLAYLANLGRHRQGRIPADTTQRIVLLTAAQEEAEARLEERGTVEWQVCLDYIGNEKRRIARTGVAYEGPYEFVDRMYRSERQPEALR